MNDRRSRPFNVFDQVEAAKGEMMQARVHLESGWTNYADQCLAEAIGRLERVLAHLGVSDGRRVPFRIVIPAGEFSDEGFAAMGVSRDQWSALSRAEQQELIDRTWNHPRREEVDDDDPEQATAELSAIPGALQRARTGSAEIREGRGIPLDEM